MSIRIADSLDGITGEALKRFYADSDFDNGRTPQQYLTAFLNSMVALAFDGERLVGVARAITDGVRCAAIFDVCVLPSYRGRGIATRLMRSLIGALRGQFVVLKCDQSLRQMYGEFGFAPLRPDDVALAIPD